MSTREQLIKAHLGLLQLAEDLDNVKLACKRAGISRSHFYEINEAFEKFGREGLAPQPKRRPRMPNHESPDLRQAANLLGAACAVDLGQVTLCLDKDQLTATISSSPSHSVPVHDVPTL